MSNIIIPRFYKRCLSITRRKGCVNILLPLVISFVALLPASLRAEFAYVANQGGNVSAYRIGANGALTPLAGSPFTAGIDPLSVAVDPLGRFVYVANRTSDNVSAYRIDANGVLTPVPGSPFPAGDIPDSVAFSP